MPEQEAFDLRDLDGVPANFDAKIDATQVLEAAIRQQTPQIARAVESAITPLRIRARRQPV